MEICICAHQNQRRNMKNSVRPHNRIPFTQPQNAPSTSRIFHFFLLLLHYIIYLLFFITLCDGPHFRMTSTLCHYAKNVKKIQIFVYISTLRTLLLCRRMEFE